MRLPTGTQTNAGGRKKPQMKTHMRIHTRIHICTHTQVLIHTDAAMQAVHTVTLTDTHVCMQTPPTSTGNPHSLLVPLLSPSPLPHCCLCVYSIHLGWSWGPEAAPVPQEAPVSSLRAQHTITHRLVSVCVATDTPKHPMFPAMTGPAWGLGSGAGNLSWHGLEPLSPMPGPSSLQATSLTRGNRTKS